MHLFKNVSRDCSRITTETYSTSFSLAIKLLHKDLRPHIHNLYGFVRFADEIVDTFHAFDKSTLLQEFKKETFIAIERKISLNPILNSLQETVNRYDIDLQLIHDFFYSMEWDLEKKEYSEYEYDKYVFGSSEAVGLMCLYVFCEGDKASFNKLMPSAKSLGAAFQKVNFLRDAQADYNQLQRVYFPGCDFTKFSLSDKLSIEADIQKEFAKAYTGIRQLPKKARFGVFVAYKYYLSLFKKIKAVKPAQILQTRIRVADTSKILILAKAGVQRQLNLF